MKEVPTYSNSISRKHITWLTITYCFDKPINILFDGKHSVQLLTTRIVQLIVKTPNMNFHK